jgi:nucleotide-binding universal stress UspA family protein
MTTSNSIVIAYDGSDNARHAITVAAQELGQRRADVVHVWEPLVSATNRLAIYASLAGATGEEIEIEAKRAQATADEGAKFARDAGFDATAVALRTDGPTAAAIVDYVVEHQPGLVVMGTRGLTGLRSAIAGSVSHQVVEHLAVPVLVVPPEHERG